MIKILRSFRFAVAGIKKAFHIERNFKIQIVVSFIVIISGILCRINAMEMLLVFICCAMVLGLELINSAIERLCNFVSPGVHPAIKKIKDYSAGAVLVSAVFSVVVGIIIFLPKLIRWIAP